VRVLGCALMLTLMLSSASAFDVSCTRTYPSGADPTSWAKQYPSGRTPIPGVSCGFALVNGRIVIGDAEKFAQFLHKHHPFLDSVSQESPGGEAREAMRIGRMIRKHLIRTGHGPPVRGATTAIRTATARAPAFSSGRLGSSALGQRWGFTARYRPISLT
jgi:hypothetical protein